MELLEKLNSYPSNEYVSMLPDSVQEDIKAYIVNHMQELFETIDERDQAIADGLNSRVSDIVDFMKEGMEL